MTDLKSGMQVMHNQHAVELLYLKDRLWKMEIWRVRLLFVEPTEKDELFEPDDLVSFIHTSQVR